MNIKQNKGYVGIDISLGVLIILIIIPTIMGIVYNINASKNLSEVKAKALNITVNSLEIAKGTALSELTEQKVLQDLQVAYPEYTVTLESGNKSAIIATTKASFRLELEVTDYHDINDEAVANTVKTVAATVTYKVGNKQDSINISTVVK